MKAPLQIEILVSTMEGKVFQNKELFFDHPQVKFTVINQTTQPDQFKNQELPKNTRIYSFIERGLSKSRNRALSCATGDILVIADDDVYYAEDFAEKLIKAYQNSNFDSVLFQNIWNPRFKRSKLANFFDLLKVSSYEISVLRRAIGDLRFDESFGLGAKYNSGEENIFLIDLKKRNSSIFIFNEKLVNHPNLGTGYIWNTKTAEAKGALCRRLFGSLGVFAFLFFATKKYSLFKSNLTYHQFLKAGLQSFVGYSKWITQSKVQ